VVVVGVVVVMVVMVALPIIPVVHLPGVVMQALLDYILLKLLAMLIVFQSVTRQSAAANVMAIFVRQDIRMMRVLKHV